MPDNPVPSRVALLAEAIRPIVAEVDYAAPLSSENMQRACDHVAAAVEARFVEAEAQARTEATELAEKKHERELGEMIDERDALHEWADLLAAALAPPDVLGEHSNMNNPWQNALDNGNYVTIRRDVLAEASTQIKMMRGSSDGFYVPRSTVLSELARLGGVETEVAPVSQETEQAVSIIELREGDKITLRVFDSQEGWQRESRTVVSVSPFKDGELTIRLRDGEREYDWQPRLDRNVDYRAVRRVSPETVAGGVEKEGTT